ncbi:MAG: DUF3052 family protein [Dehalococcoidia bacterium]|nr:MAG: DUF3052 family protein [Dehalococcoidia bacterium]
MAGYSGTPLVQKLGIKSGHRVMLLGAPEGFDATLGTLPDGVTVRTAARGTADVVVLFTTRRALLEARIDTLGAAVFPGGAVWVAWPKKAAKVPTDMTEDVVREVCLPRGLVDNKVCAIDETWSGLRVVHRVERRR